MDTTSFWRRAAWLNRKVRKLLIEMADEIAKPALELSATQNKAHSYQRKKNSEIQTRIPDGNTRKLSTIHTRRIKFNKSKEKPNA